MTAVTGSKQYRSIVVPYKPGQKRLFVLAMLALLVAVAVLSFWLGGYSIRQQYQQLTMQHEQLVAKLQVSEVTREQISQQLANAILGAEVDQKAVNEVRATVREYQQTIAQLNEEIGFYKGLMAPTEREKGLSVRSWEVYSTADPRRFQFKLVAQQLAHKHRLLKGTLDVRIVGQLSGQEQVLALSSLSEQVGDQNIKLRFKYFQNLDGEMKLPAGFEPQRVDITARATSPNVAQVERHYGWVVHD